MRGIVGLLVIAVMASVTWPVSASQHVPRHLLQDVDVADPVPAPAAAVDAPAVDAPIAEAAAATGGPGVVMGGPTNDVPPGSGCTLGCPLGVVAPVCGADGITYMTDCLATCAGRTAIAYGGACLPGGTPEAVAQAASRDATPTPASVASHHPIASLFGDSHTKSGGGAARVATLSDMRRFAQDGFVLVGAVPIGSDDPNVKLGVKPASNPDAESRGAAEKDNTPIEVFEMRLDTSKGLLYTSTKIQRGGAADLALSGPPSSAPAHPGPAGRGARPLLVSADSDTGKINTAEWPVLRSNAVFPYCAVGFLQLFVGSALRGSCTGSLYGSRAMVTAAHCLYSRSSKTWTSSAKFYPNHYYTSAGQAKQPYGVHTTKYWAWLTGWVNTPTGSSSAWWYDVCVAVLNTAPNTGYFGLATSGGAYTAQLYTAGYPAETVRAGNFHYSAYICDLSDPNGNDAVLDFKSASNPSCPRRRCPIAEPGQSGQPVWTSGQATSDKWIRGVLSHGPSSYTTCTEWDAYTELNTINYNFLLSYRMKQ